MYPLPFLHPLPTARSSVLPLVRKLFYDFGPKYDFWFDNNTQMCI